MMRACVKRWNGMYKTNGFKDDWYRRWFGTEYLKVYNHRGHSDATALIKLFLKVIQPYPGQHFLDVACGNGRHARLLAEQGLYVTGIDLSMPLLMQALINKQSALQYIRADMRALPCKAVFDGALSLFTSFGYFLEEADNELVLGQIARVLKPNGLYFMDYLNSSFVKRHLVAKSIRRADDMEIREKRWLDKERVYKEITLIKNRQKKVFYESVRLYMFDEMVNLLQQAGFVIEESFGNYRGEIFKNNSERMIFLCRKN